MQPGSAPSKFVLPQGVDAVSIDFDRTLASLGPRPIGMLRTWLSHRQLLDAWSKEIEAMRGTRHPHLRARILAGVAERSHRPLDEVESGVDQAIHKVWSSLFGPEHVPPLVRALLEHCADSSTPVAVVSDHASLSRTAQLSVEGAWTVVDCTELGALKPLPDGILVAACQLGTQPARLLHIGDRWDTDAPAAAAAGARFCHVAHLGDLLRGRLPPPADAPSSSPA